MKKQLFALLAALIAGCVFAAENPCPVPAPDVLVLPAPALNDSVSLKKALTLRQSSRQFSDRLLSDQELSNLLWAANGKNRENGKRTMPAAMGRYAVTLYVALPIGLYRHNIEKNELELQAEGDFRGASDGRRMGAQAGAVIFMTVKGVKAQKDPLMADFLCVEAGAISQNIYLYCASAGFNTVVCGSCDRKSLAPVLKLPEEDEILLAQIIGYPAE